MRFLVARWRGIGTRLYLALAFAVILTLVSSAVVIYCFEKSGDLNYQAESESVPVLEASWEAAREAERLRGLGLELLTAPEAGTGEVSQETVNNSLTQLEDSLAQASAIPVLTDQAQAVQDSAYGVVDTIDALALNRAAMQEANAAVVDLRRRMSAIPADTVTAVAALRLLGQVLRAEDEATVDGMWNEFTILAQSGLEETIVEVGGGQGVFFIQRQRLALAAQNASWQLPSVPPAPASRDPSPPSWNRLAPTPRKLWTLPSRPSTKGACSWLSSA